MPQNTPESKARDIAYKREQFVNPVKRARNVERLTADALKRLDHALLHTDVPLPDLARRFDLSSATLHERLRMLGFRAGAIRKLENTQARVALT